MARPGSLSRRIERLLNDNSFRQCFSGGRRAVVAVLLVPLALFASTTLIRVQAAAGTHSPSLALVAAPISVITPEFKAAPLLRTLQAAPTALTIQLPDRALPELPVIRALLALAPEPKAPAPEHATEMVAEASPAPVFPTALGVTVVAGSIQEGGQL